jgi:adenylosuccinate lyase
VEYFIALSKIPLPELAGADAKSLDGLHSLAGNFTPAQAAEVKAIESTTNHDVKAIEYFLKLELDKTNLKKYKEFVHFGLTSQDINNTAFPLLIKDAVQTVYVPLLNQIMDKIQSLSQEWSGIPCFPGHMDSRHHPPASARRSRFFLSASVTSVINSWPFPSMLNLAAPPATLMPIMRLTRK